MTYCNEHTSKSFSTPEAHCGQSPATRAAQGTCACATEHRQTFISHYWIFSVVFLALLFTALTVPPAAKAAPLRVVYGFDREFAPFSFENPGGEPTGFEVELVDAIFKDQDVVLERPPFQWETTHLELSAGTISITSGMVETEQRAKRYLFSDLPTFPLELRLFTKTYNRFPSAELLRGQMVSVEEGSFQHRLLQEFGGINIKPFKSRVDAIRALYHDEVVAYCGPVQNTYYYINKLNYTGITTISTPIGITEMRIAVNRDRGDILRLVNEGMKRVIESGEYDLLYRKWFVRELTKPEQAALIKTALEAVIPAYAPYTQNGQGASVLTATGKIYSACTVENARPELTTTALQAAISRAIADGEFEIRAAAIVDQKGNIITPIANEQQMLYQFGRGILTLTNEKNGDMYITGMMAEMLANPVTKETATIQYER